MKRIAVILKLNLWIVIIGLLFVGMTIIIPRLALNQDKSNIIETSIPYPPPFTSTKNKSTSTPQEVFSPIAYPPPSKITQTPSGVYEKLNTCIFKSDQSILQSPASNLADFSFSQPKIVLSSEKAISIIDWLPNNSEILISRLLGNNQSIEVFNTLDNSTKTFGEGYNFRILNAWGTAVWLEKEQAVAYIVLDSQKKQVIHINSGGNDPDSVTQYQISGSSLALGFDGKLLFFSPDNPTLLQELDIEQKQITSSAPKLSLPPIMNGSYLAKYRISPRPNNDQFAIYNTFGAYFIDRRTNQICEIDFGSVSNQKEWAIQMQWSPDGRFLTAFSVIGQPPVPFIDLVVIDTWTGGTWKVDVGKRLDMYAITWSANSRNFIVIAETPSEQGETAHDEIYLIDAFTKKSMQILSDYPWLFGTGYSGISWAPDGKTLALDCAKMAKDQSQRQGQLCLVNIEGDIGEPNKTSVPIVVK